MLAAVRTSFGKISTLGAALAVALSCSLATLPAKAATLFTASLDGSQEAFPNASTASGSATLLLNDDQNRLEILIRLTGLDLDGNQTPGTVDDNVTAAHIHFAPPGTNGGIVFGFISPNSDTSGDLVIDPIAGTIMSAWDESEGLSTTLSSNLAALFAGNLYVNIHTVNFPGGEIRGQINIIPLPAALPLLATALAGMAGFNRLKRRRASAEA